MPLSQVQEAASGRQLHRNFEVRLTKDASPSLPQLISHSCRM